MPIPEAAAPPPSGKGPASNAGIDLELIPASNPRGIEGAARDMEGAARETDAGTIEGGAATRDMEGAVLAIMGGWNLWAAMD